MSWKGLTNTLGDIATLGADRLISPNGVSGIVHGLSGQNDFRAGTYTMPFAPDAGNPVQAQYNAQKAAYDKANADFGAAIARGETPTTPAILTGGPPAPPTTEQLQAGQVQQDRARIAGTDQNYGKLVGDLQLASTGAGPSAAQDTLRAATDRNNQTAYGMAASGNVAPGQRAALLGAAGAGATLNNQAGARDAAILKANEVSTARGQLGATLGGQTDAEGRLLGQTQDTNKTNIDALTGRDQTNAGIEGANAAGKQKLFSDTVSTIGAVAAPSKSDIRAKEDIKPLEKRGGLAGFLGLRRGPIFGPGLNSPDAPPPLPHRASPTPLYFNDANGGSFDTKDQVQARMKLGGGGYQASPAFAPPGVQLAEDPNDTEYTHAAPGSDYGFSMSDERSKEKIASLEHQLGLAEQYGAVDQTEKDAYDMKDANVHYPDQGMTDRDTYAAVDKQAAMRRRAAQESPENLATFANVDRSAELRRRARIEQPVFYDEQADTMRDPVQQMRHTRELAGTGQGYPELASREGSRVALAPVHPYEYQYKPKFAQDTGADGEPRAGIMAQELAASPNPALRSAVIKDPKDGMLAIDHNRAISSSLALNAGLDKRLRDIEDALGKPTEYPTLPGGPPPRSLGLAGRQASR